MENSEAFKTSVLWFNEEMPFPALFTSNIRHAFGDDGEKFLVELPSLIREAAHRWGLTDVQPIPDLSYNFVANAVISPAGLDMSSTVVSGYSTSKVVILKIGVPHRELVSEMNALKLFNGEGACRLLDCDEEKGFLLIERLQPGTMLADLEEDDKRTHIAIDVMTKLWRPAPTNAKFIQLEDWFAELKNIRAEFDGWTGPFPQKALERVESFLPDLFADNHLLIHGDFHHFNVLSSERGWLAIDPKGVVGPVGYEIGPLMINPWGSISDKTRFEVITRRRISILWERLGWEREKIIQWALAHAILSAWWDYPGGDWRHSLDCLEVFSEIK